MASTVPFAKAYSGLTDAEIRQLERFVRETSAQAEKTQHNQNDNDQTDDINNAVHNKPLKVGVFYALTPPGPTLQDEDALSVFSNCGAMQGRCASGLDVQCLYREETA